AGQRTHRPSPRERPPARGHDGQETSRRSGSERWERSRRRAKAWKISSEKQGEATRIRRGFVSSPGTSPARAKPATPETSLLDLLLLTGHARHGLSRRLPVEHRRQGRRAGHLRDRATSPVAGSTIRWRSRGGRTNHVSSPNDDPAEGFGAGLSRRLLPSRS